ncbi:DUF4402 domain-containing protein [Sphingomonas gilva]|nr:DUF4402 domain-containing protein [Sphingomonas gilva]
MRPLFTLCAIGAAAIPGAAAAQSATGQGEVVIVRPLSLVNTEDLRFGSLIAGTAGGSAVISQTSGARMVTGGVTGAPGDFGPAQFVTAGLASIVVIISVDNATTITRAGGGASMNVTDIATNRPAVSLFPGSGVIDINVGGRLTVAANQMPGDYAGTFNLTVFYL